MKISYLIPSFILCCSLNIQAQITLQSDWIAGVGDTVWAWQDTTNGPSLDLGSAAGNQVWDFTSLEEQDDDNVLLEAPSTAPLASNFPTADYVIFDSEDSAYRFVQSTSSFVDIIGTVEYDSAGNPEVPEENLMLRFIEFPSTMGDSYDRLVFDFVQSDSVNFDPDGPGPHPFIDSIRGTFEFRTYSEIDAWGDLMLPNGNFGSIRQQVVVYIKVHRQFYGDGSWQEFTPTLVALVGDSVSYDTNSITYRWWSNNPGANFFLVDMELDSLGVASDVTWSAAAPRTGVGLSDVLSASSVRVYPNPANDRIRIEQSTGENVDVTLLDLTGREVLHVSNIAPGGEVALNAVRQGVYLLQVSGESGRIQHVERLQVAH